MPRYHVTLTDGEVQNLKDLIQKGGKGYRIKHAQILLKLDQKPENVDWTYDRIKGPITLHTVQLQALPNGLSWMEWKQLLDEKKMENHYRKVTGDIEAKICAIACSEAPEGHSRWTMQAIADELIRLEILEYIKDSTVCEVMKKTKSNRGL